VGMGLAYLAILIVRGYLDKWAARRRSATNALALTQRSPYSAAIATNASRPQG
jgi:hypothetical protein